MITIQEEKTIFDIRQALDRFYKFKEENNPVPLPEKIFTDSTKRKLTEEYKYYLRENERLNKELNNIRYEIFVLLEKLSYPFYVIELYHEKPL